MSSPSRVAGATTNASTSIRPGNVNGNDSKKRKQDANFSSSSSSTSGYQQSTLDRYTSLSRTNGSPATATTSASTKKRKLSADHVATSSSSPSQSASAASHTKMLQSSGAMKDGVGRSGSGGVASSQNVKGKAPVYATGNGNDTRKPPTWGQGQGQGQQPKKLVIKSFKVKPKLPPNYEAETWEKLKRAVHAIHGSQRVPDSLEELYKDCENLCHHKMAQNLYEKLRNECERHIVAELQRLKGHLLGDTNESAFLTTINSSWTNNCRQTIWIRSIFLYLDRTYVLQTSGLLSLWDLGLYLFREHIMFDAEVQSRTVKGILFEIERERSGDQISRELLRSLVRMFLDLGIYSTVFEGAFLMSTEEFYRNESDRKVAEMESFGSVGGAGGSGGGGAVARYLKHVEERLKQENERCAQGGVGYVDFGTRKSLIAVVEKEAIERHMKFLLDKGFDELMLETRIEDLARMFSLFARVDGLEQMKRAFSQYIRKTGLSIVTDSAHDATMVVTLLDFKSKLDSILVSSFARFEPFSNALKESFESFINQRQNRPAELIAKHVDALLKSGKGVTEDQVEETLDRCLVLFRFISGKDVFEAFYKKDLAKRLLLGRSASDDMEKTMLSKLKIECGSQFTSKLEGMFKDMEISREIMSSFRQSTRYMEQLGSLDLSVNVLTAGYWPTYPPAEVNLPANLAHCQSVFKEFYTTKHTGRVLTWQNSLGQCVLRASFPKGLKELSVSLFQAVVLLLFNNNTKLTFDEIRRETGIEEKELIRTVLSLAVGKVRVLTRSRRPPSNTATPTSTTSTTNNPREIRPDDMFEVNTGFENQLFRIKINSIQLRETEEEQKTTHEKVFQDRQYQVDAAIVRIMKTRKTLSHQQLMTELFEQLKFPVKASDLKKRVESLIDREYLERDKEDSSKYIYLA
ncbi:Cullin-4 [Quaeritorhiza haematococci]|nr:Cullin-4 [Quaeritorhiza haematococci]